MTTPQERSVLSVSQLNRKAKQLLETHLPLIWVSGEISNFAQPASGHWYFSLKDERAQVRCAMFKNANLRLRWQPKAGAHIIARARVSLYEGRGEYQLIVEHMEEAGVGALQQAYEQLKAKLLAEGLFDENRKQELPAFPKHIGVITSPTGAAIHDILTVLNRRYPIANVSVIPVAVQGEGAANEMITALQKTQAFNKKEKDLLPFDLLIIGRGGGSIEDLWAFNDEKLARTIADCSIPIISAVGHEVDFTICDFVSDVRAPTPSVSAEIATPDLVEWQQYVDTLQMQIAKSFRSQLQQKQLLVSHLRKQLRHPKQQLQLQKQQLQTLTKDLIRSMRLLTLEKGNILKEKQIELKQFHPKHQIEERRQHIQSLYNSLQQGARFLQKQSQQRLSAASALLNAVSPLSVLSRGYSIASLEDGNTVQSIEQVSPNAQVTTRLSDGHFTSSVISIDKTKSS